MNFIFICIYIVYIYIFLDYILYLEKISFCRYYYEAFCTCTLDVADLPVRVRNIYLTKCKSHNARQSFNVTAVYTVYTAYIS